MNYIDKLTQGYLTTLIMEDGAFEIGLADDVFLLGEELSDRALVTSLYISDYDVDEDLETNSTSLDLSRLPSLQAIYKYFDNLSANPKDKYIEPPRFMGNIFLPQKYFVGISSPNATSLQGFEEYVVELWNDALIHRINFMYDHKDFVLEKFGDVVKNSEEAIDSVYSIAFSKDFLSSDIDTSEAANEEACLNSFSNDNNIYKSEFAEIATEDIMDGTIAMNYIKRTTELNYKSLMSDLEHLGKAQEDDFLNEILKLAEFYKKINEMSNSVVNKLSKYFN